MSTLKVANVKFTATGNVRIDMGIGLTNNLTITMDTTGNVIANTVKATSNGCAANVFFDRSNTQYYFSPAGNSNFGNVTFSSITSSQCRPAGDNGVGNLNIFIGKRPFNAISPSGTWGVYGSGRGTTATSSYYGLDRLTHINVPGEDAEPIDVGTGYDLSYALFANGNLYTWGLNTHGQCGLGSATAYVTPTLAATNVVAAYQHPTCNGGYGSYSKFIIKKSDGYLYAAGYNGNGNLGVGDTTNRSSFTLIPGSYGAISVWNMGSAVGILLIQKSDYSIWACGYNANGQIGDGTTTSRSSLVNVTSNWTGGTTATVVKVIGGYGNYTSGPNTTGWTGMLLDDGTNRFFKYVGTYANNSNKSSPGLLFATSSTRISDISGYGGTGGTMMFLFENGDLYTAGYNGHGQLGDGTTTDNFNLTIRATGVNQIFCDGHDSFQYGFYITSFYRKGNIVYASGYNGHGECGVGDTTNRTSFSTVLLPGDFTCVNIANVYNTAGAFAKVFFGSDGRMFACGHNASNLITADNTNNVLAPIQILPPVGG